MTDDTFERAMTSLRQSRVELEAINERLKQQLKEMTEESETFTDPRVDKIGEEGRDDRE